MTRFNRKNYCSECHNKLDNDDKAGKCKFCLGFVKKPLGEIGSEYSKFAWVKPSEVLQ